MTKINIAPDCGNSPRRAFIRDFNIAFVESNSDFIIESIDDDIRWKIYGDRLIEGKANFIKELQRMMIPDNEVDEITIHSMITHGKEACSNGEMLMKDGKRFAFCDVYEFISAGKNKIGKLYSYVIEVKL